MKTTWKRTIGLLITVVLVSSTAALAVTRSEDNVWTRKASSQMQPRSFDAPALPSDYATFSLNKDALQATLNRAPEEFTGTSNVILTLPMPDGTFSRFRIEHSLVVEPGLLVNYPELGATYRGQGIDDPAATVRFDFLPSGFHAMIRSYTGTVMIDPYIKGQTNDYISYDKANSSSISDFSCEVGGKSFGSIGDVDELIKPGFAPEAAAAPEVTTGSTLRTYRLALAGDFEYCAAVGGNTVAGCLAAQVLIMNRVNGVYEKDLTIHMNIIANNNLIVYAPDRMCGAVACTAANDPYSNDSPTTLLTENQNNLDAVILTANYDVGHVFTTGGGGVATLNGPCNAGTKARGETGLPAPLGDDFAIDFVAHEMGHQFGANHTFNSTTSNCGGGNRSASSAYEPGSGITIMAYAGICGAQDLAAHSIDTFHVKSIEAIVAFSQAAGGTGGNSCDVESATGNTAPTVTGPGNFTIPKLTPFALTASATDPNGDSLTYDWQEYDLGPSTTAIPNTDNPNAMPIFRPYLPLTSGTRTFPSMQYIRNNANVPPSTTGGFLTGELMPQIGGRTMVFQVIVRDNRANGGGVNTATSSLTVNAASGPFTVTAPNTNVTWGAGFQTVTWDVAGTSAAPVSAANVKISYSTDSGNTFPTVLLASTPNDGSQTVNIPAGNTTTARIKVEAVGNIFFDISNVNFTVSGVVAPPRSRADFDGDGKTDLSVFRPSDGNWWLNRSTAGIVAMHWGLSADVLTPGDYDNDGKTDLAVWRPSDGNFYVLNSSTSTFVATHWGMSGDIPIVGDYDDDGKTDLTVYRPTDSMWYTLKSSDGGVIATLYGSSGDIPLAIDNDGDGKTNLAVFRPSQALWIIAKPTGVPAQNFDAIPFGLSTDLLVPADYDGDNKDDIAVFRPSNGTWYVLRSTNGQVEYTHFGQNLDVPVPGDYDGDGSDDRAVYRNGIWYVLRSTSGFFALAWGLSTDRPIPKAYLP